MTHVLDRVESLLAGSSNLIHLRAADPQGVREAFKDYNIFTAKAVYYWRADQGLHRVDIPHIHTPNTETLDKLLAHIENSHHPGIYLIEGYGRQLEDPKTAARLARLNQAEGRERHVLCFLGEEAYVHPDLAGQLSHRDFEA
jgi:hypothetical protein